MAPHWREYRGLLRCPTCLTELEDTAGDLACASCGSTYAASDGQIDLRIQEPVSKPVGFEFDGEYEGPENFDFDLGENPTPAVDWSNQPVPPHLDDALLSHFPEAESQEAKALDLGCGDGVHERVCERAGYDWVGLDLESPQAPIRGDVHALPFADSTFDFALSIAVLAHVTNPFVTLNEVHRVLTPGSKFIGTVAFLEPSYRYSYYHHGPLGVVNSLREAGFAVEELGPGWHSLTPIARRLFPKLPRPLLSLGETLVLAAHDGWYRVGRLVYDHYVVSRQWQRLSLAGSFRFVAVKE